MLSLLMVVNGVWTGAGLLGVASNVLLLVGDFGTTGRASRLLAAVIAAGYAAVISQSRSIRVCGVAGR